VRPIPIPDAAVWNGARRVVVAGPDGDLTNDLIRPVEVIEDRSPSTGMRVLTALCALDPGDLEALTAGGLVAVSFYGALTPFSVDVLRAVGGQEAGP
jgi:hypothetical protein